jgi:hypothetical protein
VIRAAAFMSVPPDIHFYRRPPPRLRWNLSSLETINASYRAFLRKTYMDTNTLLIIIVLVLLLGGGGWYGRGRWF